MRESREFISAYDNDNSTSERLSHAFVADSPEYRSATRQMLALSQPEDGSPHLLPLELGGSALTRAGLLAAVALAFKISRMRAKFRVREMCVAADRGMVSKAILRNLR